MPPKKDAFADLLQLATTSSSSSVNSIKNLKLGLADLAKLSGGASPDASRSSLLRPANNWANLDLLSPSPSSSISGSNSIPTTPKPLSDPFAIFDTKPAQPQQKLVQEQPKPVAAPQPIPASKSSNSHSLLDDEFTDAFVEETPEPAPQPAPEVVHHDATFEHTPKVSTPNSQRDEVVAQLLDIGFSVEMANTAIDAVGLDLQSCVNFIMSGGKNEHRDHRLRSSEGAATDDIGAKLNDLSINLFHKASSLITKSRDTVIKNIENFQSHSGSSSNDSLPAWMREQPKYKKEAIENRAGGGKYEDYGSDEDNIDQEAIRKFMEQQKLKDKERSRARAEHLKAMAKSKITGSTSPVTNLPQPTPRPATDEGFMHQRESLTRSPIKNRPASTHEPGTPKRPPRPPAPASRHPAPTARLPQQEIDLLGLGNTRVSRAERFKSTNVEEDVYVSSRRRRQPPRPKAARITVRTPLNQFQQSDYDVAKEKASKSFTNGDYDDALINYTKCLAALPEKHELRVVINSNLAITLIKLGSYREAKEHCEQGLSLICKDDLSDNDYIINEKQIKFWYIRLVSRKAEALELSELFPESLELYTELVTKFGVNDKKVMDAKRRITHIINPPPKPKSQKPARNPSPPQNNENLKRVQEQNRKQESNDNLRFELHDKVQAKVFAWSNGKEDNLRTLLTTLDKILPERLNFPFLTTKKIGLNDLMLPKKVKINYMKVISSIHPDKLAVLKLGIEDEMLCQSVFITLNKSWDLFKEKNGLN